MDCPARRSRPTDRPPRPLQNKYLLFITTRLIYLNIGSCSDSGLWMLLPAGGAFNFLGIALAGTYMRIRVCV